MKGGESGMFLEKALDMLVVAVRVRESRAPENHLLPSEFSGCTFSLKMRLQGFS